MSSCNTSATGAAPAAPLHEESSSDEVAVFRKRFVDIKKLLGECRATRNTCVQEEGNNRKSLLLQLVDRLAILAANLVDSCTSSTTTAPATLSERQTLLKDIALCWCRVAGRVEDFSAVIRAADAVLNVADSTAADAVAYKGYALFRLRRHDEAFVCLEHAKALLSTMNTGQNQRLAKLAAQVEECIVLCCLKLERDQPLPPIVKFPRIPHLFRPQCGSLAITEDDIVLPSGDSTSSMLRAINSGKTIVTCTEKIDGANLGISLAYDGFTILVQNRSHYISTGEHSQFGPLQPWIEEHREALVQILSHRGSRSPKATAGRWILYGEWMVAKHSIPYRRLPGYFVAFDLYEVDSDRFVSQRRLHEILRGTHIPVVPIIAAQSFGPSKDIEADLLNMVETTPSQFRADAGVVEGVVFRIEDGEWLLSRSKLVRPDFAAGCSEGHWSKRPIERQEIDIEFSDEYLSRCYMADTAAVTQALPSAVDNPRQRADVVYTATGSAELRCYLGNRQERSGNLTTSQENAVVHMPRILSWLWQGEVAISSTPKSANQISAFRDALHVQLIITLTEEEPLQTEWFSGGCQNFFHPVPNLRPPKLKQMDDIGDDIVRSVLSFENPNPAVLIHCGGGKGRAGTVAACLLLRFGREGIWHRARNENGYLGEDDVETKPLGLSLYPRPPSMTSEEAICEIRRVRPGSLETKAQENFVREYAQHLWRLNEELPDLLLEAAVSESFRWGEQLRNGTTDSSRTWKRKVSVAKKRRAPTYIVLAGLPGSGKSHFGRHLTSSPAPTGECNEKKRNSKSSWILASRDELGRKKCEDLVGQISSQIARGKQAGIVVDCTNVTEKDRANWLKIMGDPPQRASALVFFDVDRDICSARVKGRVNHPSIPFGRGDGIVKQFASRLEFPGEVELKRFGRVEIVRNPNDCLQLAQNWGFGPAEIEN